MYIYNYYTDICHRQRIVPLHWISGRWAILVKAAEKFLLPFINWRVIDAGLGSQICHSRLFDLERDPLRNLSLTALFADVQPCVGRGFHKELRSVYC